VTPSLSRWLKTACLLGAIAALGSGCVVADGGYYDGGAAPYYPDYYEPYGAIYGGWGPDYHVGPSRGGGANFGPGRPGGHAFRSAPGGRSIPSIPSGSRSGGGGRGAGGGRDAPHRLKGRCATGDENGGVAARARDLCDQSKGK